MASTASRLRGRGSPTDSPPMAYPGGIEIDQRPRAFAPQVGKHGALHDGEQRVTGLAGGDAAAPMLARPARAQRTVRCMDCAGVLVADRVLGAFVEHHQDVAAEGELHVDGRFRREGVQVAVEVRLENVTPCSVILRSPLRLNT